MNFQNSDSQNIFTYSFQQPSTSKSALIVDNNLTEDKERRFKCDICGKQFLTINNIDFHVRIHFQYRSSICSKCGKNLTSPTQLKQHMNFVHYNMLNPKLKCEICKRSFKSGTEVRKHLKIHLVTAKTFKCDKCQKGFKSKAELKQHQVCHEEKKFECPLCNRKFRRKQDFVRHSQNIHNRE